MKNESLDTMRKPETPKEIKGELAKEGEEAKVKDLKRPGRQPRLTNGKANG